MLEKFFEEVFGFIKSFFEKEEAVLLLFIVIIGGFFVFNFFSPTALVYLQALFLSLGRFFVLTWWLWFFLLFWPLVWSLWRYWRGGLFYATLKGKILEIKTMKKARRKLPATITNIQLNCMASTPLLSISL